MFHCVDNHIILVLKCSTTVLKLQGSIHLKVNIHICSYLLKYSSWIHPTITFYYGNSLMYTCKNYVPFSGIGGTPHTHVLKVLAISFITLTCISIMFSCRRLMVWITVFAAVGVLAPFLFTLSGLI